MAGDFDNKDQQALIPLAEQDKTAPEEAKAVPAPKPAAAETKPNTNGEAAPPREHRPPRPKQNHGGGDKPPSDRPLFDRSPGGGSGSGDARPEGRGQTLASSAQAASQQKKEAPHSTGAAPVGAPPAPVPE
ncbi:MAG: hypothetical protein SGI92_33135, partial [Bryobacteraceae bacterium]|nr:hypothetical protein [Bryobacteraceae bacterium]